MNPSDSKCETVYSIPVKPIRTDKKYDQMESFENSEDDVSTIVKALRKAGRDGSKQLPGLIKLGEWYLDKGKATTDSADFTKANALFNAALVRSSDEANEDHIQRRIVETYREFLATVAKCDDEVTLDEIRNEIDSHKGWIARERRLFNERVNEIDQDHKTEQDYEVFKPRSHYAGTKLCRHN